MCKRKPLGIPLEMHRQFAPALMRLNLLAPKLKHGAKLAGICTKLRDELDEHIHIEFIDLSSEARNEIYYTPAKDFDPRKGDLEDLFPVIDMLTHCLSDYAPGTRVCQIAHDLRKETEKFVGR